jgi:transmembrane sensor
MTSRTDPSRAFIARQAADWFVANQGALPGQAERAAFVSWLRTSPLHVEEYLGMAVVASDLRMATAGSDETLESLLDMARADVAGRVVPVRPPQMREPSTRQFAPLRRWSLAAAAVAALAVVAWWSSAHLSEPQLQRYVTGRGEQNMQRLADGSILHLNADSGVEVRFDRSRRDVRLVTGEAFFTVAHGDPRKFRVRAGDTDIVAVGTRFDVRVKRDSTLVTVVEGQVDVRAEARAGAVTGRTMRVPAGYQLQIDDGVLPAQSERVDTGAAVAWLQHRIAFERQPLGDVADEFNRYGVVKFVIEDPGLRSLPVSGIFNAYDTNSFIAFLESLDQVHVERSPERILVTRQEATNSR